MEERKERRYHSSMEKHAFTGWKEEVTDSLYSFFSTLPVFSLPFLIFPFNRERRKKDFARWEGSNKRRTSPVIKWIEKGIKREWEKVSRRRERKKGKKMSGDGWLVWESNDRLSLRGKERVRNEEKEKGMKETEERRKIKWKMEEKIKWKELEIERKGWKMKGRES